MVAPTKFIEQHNEKKTSLKSWTFVRSSLDQLPSINNADVESRYSTEDSCVTDSGLNASIMAADGIKEDNKSNELTKYQKNVSKSSDEMIDNTLATAKLVTVEKNVHVEDKVCVKNRRTNYKGNDANRYKYRCVILPHSVFRTNWELYMTVLLIYVGLFIPFRVSYLGKLNGALEAFDLFVDLSFGLDIVLHFLIAYEKPNGQLECRHSKLAKRYFKGYFALDFIATVPLDRIFEQIHDINFGGINKASKLTRLPRLMKILRIARLIKVIRLYRFKKWISEMQLYYSVHEGVTRLLNIGVIILFATHLVGCLWHALGVSLDNDWALQDCNMDDDDTTREQGWVCREGMIKSSLGSKYIASIYWAFSTLTTVGYGDIYARTIPEQSFSMIMMLLGVSWYAYVVGSMSTIIASFDRQNKQVRGKMLEVNTFIRETKIPPELGRRVRQYYEYALSQKKNGLSGYDADVILQELSSNLRTEVILNVEADLVEKIPFFAGKTPTFIGACIQMLQPLNVQEGDFIIKEGSAADEMFFLVKGTAAVIYGTNEVKRLEKGAYFGEIGCILGGVRRAAVVALCMCEIQSLSKHNLNLLLSQHPSVGEDLKKVARARMSEVNKSKVDETALRKNSLKLDQINFQELQTANDCEAFSDLKTEVESIARRLSLTSGVMNGGSHIQADGKAMAHMNRNMNDSTYNKNLERDAVTTVTKEGSNLKRSDCNNNNGEDCFNRICFGEKQYPTPSLILQAAELDRVISNLDFSIQKAITSFIDKISDEMIECILI